MGVSGVSSDVEKVRGEEKGVIFARKKETNKIYIHNQTSMHTTKQANKYANEGTNRQSNEPTT